MAKVNAKVNVNAVATVATVAQSVAPVSATASQFAGLKYVAGASGAVFAPIAQLAAQLATVQATQAQLISAACAYYGINALAWANKHANKGGAGCLTVAKTLATAQGTTAQLYMALIAQCSAAPKGGKYAPALVALGGLANGGKVASTNQAILAICAVAWAWGYLANKQVNGQKGNLPAALAMLA